jgi:toxin-antitoxin system PIN domain toxin
MKGYLLDTNLLIALFWPKHQHHRLAARWFARHRSKGWATCPLTQAGFVRIVSNPAFSRDAVQPRDAMAVLQANMTAKDHQFWPDELPVSEAVDFAGPRLVGHQQIVDAYLLGMAISHGGILATLDQGISALAEPRSSACLALETIE